MKINKNILAASLCLSLTACGGGGSGGTEETVLDPVIDPAPVTYNVGGRAIDGYLVGATAWLDIDGDGVLDSDEPSAETMSGGEYDLDLTEAQLACLPYSTLYVDVPAGAMDESEGEVLEPYQLAFPPSFDADKTDNIMVTPLTTVVWQGVQVALWDSGYSLSCASVAADETLRNRIEGSIERAIDSVVYHYNIPAEKVFSDYIADGNTELQDKAVDIVKGLQASLTATIEAWEAHPSANYVMVQFYQGSALDNGVDYLPQQWYRDESVWSGDTSSHRVVRVDADLTTEGALILSSESTYEKNDLYSWSDGSVWESRNGDGAYECERSQALWWDMNEITTLYDTSLVSDESSCRQPPSGAVQTQYNFVQYSENSLSYVTQFAFSGFENIPLPETIDEATLAEFDSALLDLPYRWEDQGVAGAAWVARSQTEEFVEGEVASIQMTRMEYQDGSEYWTRTSNYRDGTRLEECSLNGQDWSPEGNCQA